MTTISAKQTNYVMAVENNNTDAPRNLTFSLNEYEKYCENHLVKPLTTINGKFSVNMRREATNNVRAFDKIDKDKNGILSELEICNARNKSVKNTKDAIFLSKTLGYASLGGAIILAGVAPEIGICFLIGGGIALATGEIIKFSKHPRDEWNKTQEYKEKHTLDAEA